MTKGQMVLEEKARQLRGSQLVLQALREAKGDWVEGMYQKTGVMVHSRVSDLRRQGYRIECKHFGRGDYRYRLVEGGQEV